MKPLGLRTVRVVVVVCCCGGSSLMINFWISCFPVLPPYILFSLIWWFCQCRRSLNKVCSCLNGPAWVGVQTLIERPPKNIPSIWERGSAAAINSSKPLLRLCIYDLPISRNFRIHWTRSSSDIHVREEFEKRQSFYPPYISTFLSARSFNFCGCGN